MENINFTFTELVGESTIHVEEYLRKAIFEIDNQLGQGYAEKHPELIGAFINSCATQYNGSAIAKAVAEFNFYTNEGKV